MAKVEAMKRTKNRQAELMQVYKEERKWYTMPKNDGIVNKEDDAGYESENWGALWKNYKDEKHITNNELEVVFRGNFKENRVRDFSYLKTWFNQEKFVYPMYCPCG